MNRDIKMVTLLGLHNKYLDTAWLRGHSISVSYDVLQLESLIEHRQMREHSEQQDTPQVWPQIHCAGAHPREAPPIMVAVW